MELGYRPPPLPVLLPVGGTYAARIRNLTGPWAAGLTIDLYFEGNGAPVTWSATIAGDLASWSKTVSQVTAILSADLRTVSLRGTPSGGEPVIWRRGTVEAV